VRIGALQQGIYYTGIFGEGAILLTCF
jgi:hypothetical protein